jgi:hypothetical protein
MRTGQSQSIEVKPSYGLSDNEVERMIEDSFKFAQEDVSARKLISASDAGALFTTTEKSLAEGASSSPKRTPRPYGWFRGAERCWGEERSKGHPCTDGRAGGSGETVIRRDADNSLARSSRKENLKSPRAMHRNVPGHRKSTHGLNGRMRKTSRSG